MTIGMVFMGTLKGQLILCFNYCGLCHQVQRNFLKTINVNITLYIVESGSFDSFFCRNCLSISKQKGK